MPCWVTATSKKRGGGTFGGCENFNLNAFIDRCKSHFCHQIHQCVKIGEWGVRVKPIFQCQDFGSASHSKPSITDEYMEVHSLFSANCLNFRRKKIFYKPKSVSNQCSWWIVTFDISRQLPAKGKCGLSKTQICCNFWQQLKEGN